jgi:hypothetical protein
MQFLYESVKEASRIKMSIFTKDTLLRMNASREYGYNWIVNLENMKDTDIIQIYPTGNMGGIGAGRIYFAIQAYKEPSREQKIIYKILE